MMGEGKFVMGEGKYVMGEEKFDRDKSDYGLRYHPGQTRYVSSNEQKHYNNTKMQFEKRHLRIKF